MKRYVMGNGAIAFGALSAGVSLVTGYPGTPSSEIIEAISKVPVILPPEPKIILAPESTVVEFAVPPYATAMVPPLMTVELTVPSP